MRDTMNEPQFMRDKLPTYRKPRRSGRVLLYLVFFLFGAMTAIALSFVISFTLLQMFLELLIKGVGFLIQALYEGIVALVTHPSVLLLSLSVVMIFVIIWLLRQRG